MQDIVQDALENAEAEKRSLNDQMDEDDDFGEPRIVIVGAGGAGNNTVNRLYNLGVNGADTVAINTDKQHLKMIEATLRSWSANH
jgi:Cell division GTPase